MLSSDLTLGFLNEQIRIHFLLTCEWPGYLKGQSVAAVLVGA